ncbi:MAG: flavodoxin family protein [Candidatus Bathyarchaeota archaeon]|nr:flavodoxin family protein [Candidatus Bathyarchaeota archaeon]
MILGISASGRVVSKNQTGILVKGVTEEMVEYILQKSGEPHELVSLADKTIRGCTGCCGCAKDNVCVLTDDWAEIRDKMYAADAIVFGAPNYYGVINAMGHAFLERTFSLRHRERFPLSGKLNAIVTVGSEEDTIVEDFIRKFFRGQYMAESVGALRVSGISQCYQCGYGESCAAGSVVAKHGFLPEIRDYHLPVIDRDTYRRAAIIAHRLGEVVRTKRASAK